MCFLNICFSLRYYFILFIHPDILLQPLLVKLCNVPLTLFNTPLIFWSNMWSYDLWRSWCTAVLSLILLFITLNYCLGETKYWIVVGTKKFKGKWWARWDILDNYKESDGKRLSINSTGRFYQSTGRRLEWEHVIGKQ